MYLIYNCFTLLQRNIYENVVFVYNFVPSNVRLFSTQGCCICVNMSVYLLGVLRYMSSSSCHAISTDIPDPLSPPLPIVHCFRQVFRATSRIDTELLYVGSSWSSCLCSAMWRGPQEYIAYELVPTSPAVSRMSGSSNFDSFRDSLLVAVQLLLYGVLHPGLVQYCL